jgi:hypothetical protein
VYGQTESGDPPPPVVTIYKRASCDDQDSEPSNDCTVNGNKVHCQYTADGVNRCGYLGIQVTGARGTFGCLVVEHDDGLLAPPRPYQANMGNGDTATDWIFDSGRVGVKCEGGGKDFFSVTAYMDWP